MVQKYFSYSAVLHVHVAEGNINLKIRGGGEDPTLRYFQMCSNMCWKTLAAAVEIDTKKKRAHNYRTT